MPFGIGTASEVYHRMMKELLAGYPCAIIVDDSFPWGSGTAKHDTNLHKVMQQAREVNIKLTVKTCKFRLDKVSYVGHKFTKDRLRPHDVKVAVVR